MPNQLTNHAQAIFDAAVDSVRGEALMRENVRFEADEIWLGEQSVLRDDVDRIVLVGAGKASGAMAVGMIERYRMDQSRLLSGGEVNRSGGPTDLAGGRPRDLEWIGHVNVPEGCDVIPGELDWPSGVKLHAARPTGVNEPTSAAIQGTDRILELVRGAGPRDLVVVLISGGGSALLVRPAGQLSLDDLLTVIRHLSSSGADITELNTVRKHLSAVKGGRLAQACQNAPMFTLILSDVLGDPLDLIASGPTVPDTSVATDALSLLKKYDPDQSLPPSVYTHLVGQVGNRVSADGSSAVDSNRAAETAVTLVLGNNAVAVDAGGIRAESLGYNHIMQCARSSEGTAESVGQLLAEMTVGMLRSADGRNESSDNDSSRDDSKHGDPTRHFHDALITGGEPVVHLADAGRRGRGGRNQQLVLAAYARLLTMELTDSEWDRLVILSGGTDGEDGPTDAAGAWVDGRVHTAARQMRLEPQSYLDRNDAYSFFEQAGGLLMTGPTGTNVCDVRVALVC
ncbi:hydroxypyruvate reductase/glycerate kinase [Neorhodopirellula lusitana]|uniref:Hydroxypyruvate reductase/glycerate kinase n=1 Tax=Neorhodopirellula lusitana TaxID=445327 RepID=A0ABY1QAG5_9BACT|nr:DUF4147 domain-containing protein [Neorhodopirellula lusitana]SMP63182.1 hydroxypyruvate reductase/glycerate kinase [Neorhodopirellula lusitana]